jgi:DNA sulfur modification protein DndB
MSMSPIHLPALFAQLGDWEYYTTIMHLEDVAKRVDFAANVNEVRPGRQLSDLIQRAFKEGRAKDIARYLLAETDHFFNALVVAVYGGDPKWMEFEVTPSAEARSSRAPQNVPEWARSAFGYLVLSGEETLFALDGQHRLAGIQLAVQSKTALGKERVTVIFVSHKRTNLGRKRTRKLFTTLNKMAVPVNKSEIIALDESDTGATITRRLVEEHKFFSKGQVLAKYGATNLPARNEDHYITIIKLYDIVTYILLNIHGSIERKKASEWRYVRPDDVALERIYDDVSKFFELFIGQFPELREYFEANGAEAKLVIKREQFDVKNILFRAVGLEIFLQLIVFLNKEGLEIKSAVAKLGSLPRHFTEEPFCNVDLSRFCAAPMITYCVHLRYSPDSDRI